MSDIGFEFSALEWLALIPLIGWPGLLAGAALGALAWRRRRIAGMIVGAVLGCVLWFFGALLLK